MVRAALITQLVELILARRPAHVLRVAVDGPDAAGKSTLAEELAQALAGRRETIRVSIDGFHRPREVRHRRGSLSPEGYYHDSFDYDAVRALVLEPLGPGGTGRYRKALFDHVTDTAVDSGFEQAPDGAVLLFDGVFLLRPELRDCWDLRIFLDISPDEAVRRAVVRDVDLFGSPAAVRDRYRLRYLPGQQLYRAAAEPATAADVVIDHDDPAGPQIVRWPAAQ